MLVDEIFRERFGEIFFSSKNLERVIIGLKGEIPRKNKMEGNFQNLLENFLAK